MSKKILIDMDGVLVDFVRGCFKHFKRDDIKYTDIAWDLEKIFFPGREPRLFWEELGYDFWINLDWHPVGKRLFDHLEDRYGVENLCICTSPARTAGCIGGKMEWLRQNLPQMQRNFMVTPKKEFAASKDRILLDDHEPNLEKFEAAGGHTVLVNQPWNRGKHRLDPDGNYCPWEIFCHVVNKAESSDVEK